MNKLSKYRNKYITRKTVLTADNSAYNYIYLL